MSDDGEVRSVRRGDVVHVTFDRPVYFNNARRQGPKSAADENPRLKTAQCTPMPADEAAKLPPRNAELARRVFYIESLTKDGKVIKAQRINAELGAQSAHDPDLAHEPEPPPSVREAAKLFLTDPIRASTANTRQSHAPRLDTLVTILGSERLIGGVSKQDCRKVLEALYQLPREYRRRYADLTLQQAIERGRAETAASQRASAASASSQQDATTSRRVAGSASATLPMR